MPPVTDLFKTTCTAEVWVGLGWVGSVLLTQGRDEATRLLGSPRLQDGSPALLSAGATFLGTLQVEPLWGIPVYNL